jgi:hypothetical protein
MTDMKHVLLYVVLPKDSRYASFEDPEYGAWRFEADSGVIEGATFKGALFGAGVAMLTLALFPPRSEAHGTLPDVLQ